MSPITSPTLTIIYTTLLLRALAAPLPAMPSSEAVEPTTPSTFDNPVSHTGINVIQPVIVKEPTVNREDRSLPVLTVRAPEEQDGKSNNTNDSQQTGNQTGDDDGSDGSERVPAEPARSMAVFGLQTGICSVM